MRERQTQDQVHVLPLVTADSMSMLADAFATDRPVEAFAMSAAPDWRSVVAKRWQAIADAHPRSLVAIAFRAAIEAGLVTSVRAFDRLIGLYEQAGFFRDPARAVAAAAIERQRTVDRMRLLISADRIEVGDQRSLGQPSMTS